MSISMKSILAAAVASLVVGNAMAADGTINFKGEITAAACSITGGAGTTVGGAAGNQTIDVNLGKISIDSLSVRKVWRCGRYGRCCQRLPALHPGIQLSSATWAGYVYTPLHEV